MNKNAQLQTADQTLKGGVMGLATYAGYKLQLDPEFIALAVPVISGLLAAISTKVGNRSTACLFVAKDETPQP